MASWCWSGDDLAARRLAAVQIVKTDAATARETAAGFEIDEPTLWRWRKAGLALVSCCATTLGADRPPSFLHRPLLMHIDAGYDQLAARLEDSRCLSRFTRRRNNTSFQSERMFRPCADG